MSQQTVTLAVSGMHCGSCVRRVERALSGVPGVTKVKVDLIDGKATVDYDGDSVVKLKEAVREQGFRVAD